MKEAGRHLGDAYPLPERVAELLEVQFAVAVGVEAVEVLAAGGTAVRGTGVPAGQGQGQGWTQGTG